MIVAPQWIERVSWDQSKVFVNLTKESIKNASPWLIWLGRFGYAAKGIIFVIVGILAAYSAVGAGKANDGTISAMNHIEELPFGQFLLIVVAIGLVCYALWLSIQTFMDTENEGSDAKGLIARGIYAISGLIYLGLALSAVKIILDVQSNGDSSQSWMAWLLSQPFGQWLVALVGLINIAIGCYQFYRAYTADFREKLLLGEMRDAEKTWATYIGRIGFAARGLVFILIGWFLLFAAYNSNLGETRGLGGAMRTLEQQAYGAWLLGFAAAGFICYGLFMLVLAKYRRMIIE